ncbi:hypothetical protein Vadar_010872 [Vaccinium darrowii]|uniref:Uncharacterized protein n=1 Tax=Vaccinium darrowii TaxID=229202 RepID=A0ACB7YLW4_9ERIC|nr:hypothetical protein Vadar_010872 [Vaccinium darrowii]
MESSWCSIAWLSVSLAIALFLLLSWTKVLKRSSTKQRPPGPTGWPVIGNMFDLGTMPHQNLYMQAQIQIWTSTLVKAWIIKHHGYTITKGSCRILQEQRLNFLRPKMPDALTSWKYNQGSLAVGNYGTYWRILRRLCSSELLVNKRINGTAALREKCVNNMIRWIEEDSLASRACGGSGEVQISRFLFLMAFNVVGNLMLSRDLLEPHSEKGHEFFDAMSKIMELAGKPNVADFLPFLKWMDPMGIKRNSDRHMGQAMKIAAEFVTERVQKKHSGDGNEGPDKISERNVTIIILEMFFGRSETTSSTIEWAMVELLRSPDSMKKVKQEINSIIGLHGKVEEKNMGELLYLHAVVKETLRLHPAIPFLVPRNAMKDSSYMGYQIPKNTQVLVNAWAIGRDTESWDDPLSFKPEKFLGKNIEYKGQHFQFIPFGSRRRICVGFALAE